MISPTSNQFEVLAILDARISSPQSVGGLISLHLRWNRRWHHRMWAVEPCDHACSRWPEDVRPTCRAPAGIETLVQEQRALTLTDDRRASHTVIFSDLSFCGVLSCVRSRSQVVGCRANHSWRHCALSIETSKVLRGLCVRPWLYLGLGQSRAGNRLLGEDVWSDDGVLLSCSLHMAQLSKTANLVQAAKQEIQSQRLEAVKNAKEKKCCRRPRPASAPLSETISWFAIKSREIPRTKCDTPNKVRCPLPCRCPWGLLGRPERGIEQ